MITKVHPSKSQHPRNEIPGHREKVNCFQTVSAATHFLNSPLLYGHFFIGVKTCYSKCHWDFLSGVNDVLYLGQALDRHCGACDSDCTWPTTQAAGSGVQERETRAWGQWLQGTNQIKLGYTLSDTS